MNSATRNLIGLAASLMLACSAWATTQPLDPIAFPLGGTLTFTALNGSAIGSSTCLNVDDPACGTLPASHGGQTVGWGYQIQNLSQYWFGATGVTASGWSHSTPWPNGDIFDYPVIAPSTFTGDVLTTQSSAIQQYTVAGSTGLFEIKWDQGLQYNTHETGLFTLSGDFYLSSSDAFNQINSLGSVEISSAYDASAPEPFSVLLFATAFGVALWGKSRVAAKRPAVQAERQG